MADFLTVLLSYTECPCLLISARRYNSVRDPDLHPHWRPQVHMALASRKFGTTCPLCKRFCFLSYIEIDEKASVGELRAQLLQQGWLGEPARCDDPKCAGETYCAWNQAVFPR